MKPPWQVSDHVHELSLVGCLIAWKDNGPVFMRLPGTDDLFIAVFTTEAKLRAMDIAFDSIKRIDDTVGFISSLPMTVGDDTRLRIMHDPYATTQGTTRFKEIQR